MDYYVCGFLLFGLLNKLASGSLAWSFLPWALWNWSEAVVKNQMGILGLMFSIEFVYCEWDWVMENCSLWNIGFLWKVVLKVCIVLICNGKFECIGCMGMYWKAMELNWMVYRIEFCMESVLNYKLKCELFELYWTWHVNCEWMVLDYVRFRFI